MIISENDPEYRQCTVSVMDNIADSEITFDKKGISNYFYEYKLAEEKFVRKGQEGEDELAKIIEQIKEDGKDRKYDCVLGVSGGLDSTFLAYYAHKVGLRVLCVHFDNGWNSELAVKNIETMVSKCGFDLYTYVINWQEFRDIQISYFKANVIDIEAVTDIAIMAALDKVCLQQKIKHIIVGLNIVTEITLPSSWTCKNTSNLRDIHRKFGTLPLKSYPILSPVRRRMLARRKPFKEWMILNYLPYNKAEVKALVQKELDWKDYGGKHYESVFTRFYQGYILPRKFHVDKRKAHLSNLIFSGQLTKEEAIEKLKEPVYPDKVFKTDYDFVLKKLGFSHEWFENYLKAPAVPHSDFELSLSIFDEYSFLRPFKGVVEKYRNIQVSK